jgi:2-oxoglutarate dehydrogenase E1 component
MKLPLVVFTPKSLLRHPMVVSKVHELTNGTFSELIDDDKADPEIVEKVVFVSGRLFYDLAKYKVEHGISNIALVRIEQIFPVPEKQIKQVVEKYAKATELLWVQDEPMNMGAWPFINRKLHHFDFNVVARPESASPAVGLAEIHKQGLEKIMESVFPVKEVVT